MDASSWKESVCNLCKQRNAEEQNNNNNNDTIAVIVTDITLISLSYFLPFTKIHDDNSGTGMSGLIYIFPLPLPLTIPIDSHLLWYIVFPTPILILVVMTKRLLLSSL